MNAWLALARKDGRALLNSRLLAREQSRFKMAFLAACGLGLMLGLGLLFLDGFRFLGALGGIGVLLIRHLFALFFFGLGLMLALSSIVTAYAVLFHSDEVRFLWCCPVPLGTLLLHKWAENAWLSAWAFFCIILPFMGAFALHERLSPWFLLWALVFAVPFALLCSGLGLAAALILFRWGPRWRLRTWGLLAAAAGLGAWLAFQRTGAEPVPDDTVFLLARLTPGLKLAAFPLWPSRWVADGLTAWAHGRWARGGLLLGVLLAQVLALGALLEAWGGQIFRGAWLRINDAAPRPASARHALVGQAWLAWLAPDTRSIWLKDWRLLWRDPAQTLQSLFFFGILALYFFNLRNLNYHLLSAVWRNLIVFLNMFSLSAVMCSLCSRFVYPQLSLEGQSFWLLGLAPTSAWRILRAKFLGALAGMLALSVGLMAISTAMLAVEPRVRVAALAVAAAMPFGLCGLASGLGAVFLDLRQRNPVAILSGFGGTLNLSLSLLFMIAAILPFGMLHHAALTGRLSAQRLGSGSAAAGIWLLLITLAATILPLHAGRRSLAARDY